MGRSADFGLTDDADGDVGGSAGFGLTGSSDARGTGRILASFCLTPLLVTLHLLRHSTHPGVQPFLDDDAL